MKDFGQPIFRPDAPRSWESVRPFGLWMWLNGAWDHIAQPLLGDSAGGQIRDFKGPLFRALRGIKGDWP